MDIAWVPIKSSTGSSLQDEVLSAFSGINNVNYSHLLVWRRRDSHIMILHFLIGCRITWGTTFQLRRNGYELIRTQTESNHLCQIPELPRTTITYQPFQYHSLNCRLSDGVFASKYGHWLLKVVSGGFTFFWEDLESTSWNLFYSDSWAEDATNVMELYKN